LRPYVIVSTYRDSMSGPLSFFKILRYVRIPVSPTPFNFAFLYIMPFSVLPYVLMLCYNFSHLMSLCSGQSYNLISKTDCHNILLASATVVVIPLFFAMDFRRVCHRASYACASFTVLADATIVVIPLSFLLQNFVEFATTCPIHMSHLHLRHKSLFPTKII
jgi:hypothetical protein